MAGDESEHGSVARVAWEPNDIPRSLEYGDIYYSTAGGLGEARHVFLAGNGLPERWRGERRFTIVETGFGTGLSFLATWALHRAEPAGSAGELRYIEIEKHPLARCDQERALRPWPELAPLTAELLAAMPENPSGSPRIAFDGGGVELELRFEALEAALTALEQRAEGGVDAWYLHGFAPERNPEMWTPLLFRTMGALTRPGGTCATFTVAALVRAGLRDAGFEVTRAAGFGPKREMLRGKRSDAPAV